MTSTVLAAIAGAAVLLGFITAVLGLVNQRRVRETADKVQSISVQVNGRLSQLLERQSQLLDALHESGTPVPPRPPEIPPAPDMKGGPPPLKGAPEGVSPRRAYRREHPPSAAQASHVPGLADEAHTTNGAPPQGSESPERWG